jgi:hypothetical protein
MEGDGFIVRTKWDFLRPLLGANRNCTDSVRYRCLMTFPIGGCQMRNGPLLATDRNADLDSLILDCDSTGCWDRTRTSTAIAVPDHVGSLWPAVPHDDGAVMVFTLQFILRGLTDHYPLARMSRQVWELLEQCDALIRRVADAKRVVPQWDAIRRELVVGGQIVRRFRVPAPNQVAILAAFQEEGWPHGILDPLRGNGDQDAKRRLNDTVKALNRRRLARIIHFSGDGTGEGVTWELVHDWR